jgi:cytochrome bd-type quinol oxidase subunit 1
MKKTLAILILSSVTLSIMVGPLCIPEEWIYIKHNESIYYPIAEMWLSISSFLMGMFAGYGVFRFFESVFND